jgi:hypothetical protein
VLFLDVDCRIVLELILKSSSLGVRGSVFGYGTMLQAGRPQVRFPMSPSSRTVAVGSTQPVTEMSTRNLPEGKGRPALKADHLTAICELIV